MHEKYEYVLFWYTKNMKNADEDTYLECIVHLDSDAEFPALRAVKLSDN